MLFPLRKRTIIRGFQEHIDASLGIATDYEASIGTPIYSPFYGTLYHFHEPQGGTWIGIKRDDGMRFEFAHLSSYAMPDGVSCKPGDIIAYTGNTGTVTTNPHLHHQIIGNDGERIDPETFYTPTSLPLIAVNATIPFLTGLQKDLLEKSQGMFTISWDRITHPLSVGMGMLTQTEAYAIADTLFDPAYLPFRYLFLFYKGNPLSSFLATYLYPAKNCAISTIPTGTIPAMDMTLIHHTLFEFSHQVGLMAHELAHATFPIEDTNFPTDELITTKLRLALPYADLLAK